jgi:serine protease Do
VIAGIKYRGLIARRVPWTFAIVVGACMALLPAAAQAQSPREAFDRVNPSVVVVHTLQRVTDPTQQPGALTDGGVGSGVLVSPDGRVLTAAHVVQAADRVTVEFADGQRVAARVVGSAPFADVALLKVETVPGNAVVASLGDSSAARVGDPIFVIGSPYGFSHTLTAGWLSARRFSSNIIENLTALEVLQLDVAIFEGNSGGPVFNLNGEVIGLVSHVLMSARSPSTGPAFAVASNVARQLMLDEPRAWLGVETALVEGQLASGLNLPQAAGLLVQSVAEGSLGERLGLREGQLPMTVGAQTLLIGGDVILSMLGVTITFTGDVFADIQRRLGELRPFDPVEMTVLRAGRVVMLTAIVRAP